MIGAPSILRLIHRAVVLARMQVADLILSYYSELFVVYYESIKRELKIRPIYECRCDERLQTKDRDEVNRREDCECVR